MAKMYTMDDLKKAMNRTEKKEQIKRKFRNAKTKTCDWCKRNADIVILLTPFAIYAGRTIVKAVCKNANLKKEQKVKDLYCYDRALGHYWKLNRELRNSEWVQIDKRKAKGERLADILDEMKVLK